MSNLLRRLAPLLWITLACAAVAVLVSRADAISIPQLLDTMASFSMSTIVLALLCCVAAFAILSAYEVVAVRVASGKQLIGTAAVTSWIAHSLGHVIGAALLSGGALRYRRYAAAGLTIGQVSRITVLSAIPYVLAAGWILDLALLCFAEQAAHALHVPKWAVLLVGAIGLLKDLGWVVFVARRRAVTFRRWTLELPSVAFTLFQIAVGIAEIALVAAILYLFLPDEHGLGLMAFTGIYLIAATIAQLSHVPAGLGVLEAALLLLLPQIPPSTLLAAVLCYRGIFEVLPLLVGGALLLHAELRPRRAAATTEIAQSTREACE